MKVFKVYVDDWSWDQYDSCIVVAESEEDVRSMLKSRDTWYTGAMEVDAPAATENTVDCYFENNQGEIHIKEINLNVKDVICASFNAG